MAGFRFKKVKSPLSLSTFSGGKKRRFIPIYIALFFVISLVAGFVIGSNYKAQTLTGQVIAQEEKIKKQAQEITKLMSDLKNKTEKITDLGKELSKKDVQIEEYKKEAASYSEKLSEAEKSNAELEKQKQEVIDEKNSLAEENENLQKDNEELNLIVKDSVRPLCCSLNDILTGTMRNWNIESGKLICSGSNTVNCATGELNAA